MALNANALVSLATLKTYVKVPISVTSEDSILERFINGASERCERYCNRRFTSQQYTEIRDGGRINEILLFQWPVTGITSLHVDSDRDFDADALIDPSNYSIISDQNAEGIGLRRYDAFFPKGAGTIQIVYTAGYTAFAAPSDLQEACLLISAYWYKLQQQEEHNVASKSKGDEDVTLIQGIPVNASQILDDYKRLDVVTDVYPIVNV